MSKNVIVKNCYECPLCKHLHEGVKMKTICSETGEKVGNCYKRIAKSCPYVKK